MRTLLSGLITLAVSAATLVLTSPAEAATRYTVTAVVSAANADVGTDVTLTGRVSPGARGQQVLVQRRTGSAWTTVARARVKRHGRYSASAPVAAPGDNVYRVVKPRHRTRLRGVSPVLTVVGWRWRSLTSLPATSPSTNAAVVPSVTIRYVPLGPALLLGSASASLGEASYTLDNLCSRFDADLGVSAASATSNQHGVLVRFDTDPAPVSYLTLDDLFVARNQHPLHLVYGPSTMLAAQGIQLMAATDPGDYVALADPKVYCRS